MGQCPDVLLGSLCKSEGNKTSSRMVQPRNKASNSVCSKERTFRDQQVGLRLLVRIREMPVVGQKSLVGFGTGCGPDLEEKACNISETVLERFNSDSSYPTRISGTGEGIHVSLQSEVHTLAVLSMTYRALFITSAATSASFTR